MADNTKIEWADATWNPVTGCQVVSPGCTNCYAMRLAGTRLKHTPSRTGLTRPTKAGPVWNGIVRLNAGMLDQPLRWRRPRRIFTCAHGDLFAESVPDEWIDRVFAVMALAPQHTFLVLTKRSARMRQWFADPERDVRLKTMVLDWHDRAREIGLRVSPSQATTWALPNVWLGVSVEDQMRADERIPDLLATPAAKRFISAEPLLGPIDLSNGYLAGDLALVFDPRRGDTIRVLEPHRRPVIDWVIAGGESGPGARPMHPDWARSLRDQCQAAGVPFFFKQHGAWIEWRQAGITRIRNVTPQRPSYNGPYLGECLQTEAVIFPRAPRIGMNEAGENGGAGQTDFLCVGKTAAGRLLDGRIWSEFPA